MGLFSRRRSSQPCQQIEVDAFVLNGHSQAVIDMDFNPFHDNILATGSEDAGITVRIRLFQQQRGVSLLRIDLVDPSRWIRARLYSKG